MYIKVDSSVFFEVIGKLNVSVTPEGSYPYKTMYRLKNGELAGYDYMGSYYLISKFVIPKNQNYRVCYGIPMNEETKRYELKKYCNCERCKKGRIEHKYEPRSLNMYTADITKVDEMAEYLKDWTCEKSLDYLPRVMIDWDTKEIGKLGNDNPRFPLKL